MIKRTIEISQEPAHLAIRLDQLLVKRHGDTVGSIPCEDVGIVVVDQGQTTYTHAALARLAEAGAAVVLCGSNHLPAAMLLPLASHSQVVWRIAEQLAASKPVRKQLWRQIVQAKIRAQAKNLADSPPRRKLLALTGQVKSADATNVEAYAAKIYWRHWLGDEPFRRDPDLADLNCLLNYGYAIVRAAVARALVAAGLLPALGLHHQNRSNAFCLADDLMEPLRPLVDARVRDLYRNGLCELTPPAKAALLQIPAEKVRLAGDTGPLMVSLHRMVASLLRCYRGESKHLDIPRRLHAADETDENTDSTGRKEAT